MDLRGLLILIGIAAVSALAAEVVIDKPGLYRDVAASRLVINASGVVVENATVRGGAGEVELPKTMTAYRLKPTAGCVVVAGHNVTLRGVSLECASGVLIFNSTDVFIEGIRAAGSPQLPVYKRGVGLYVYNSTGVYVAGGLFEYFHDCIYVEYSREVSVRNVSASNCRYGVHVMFSVGVEVAWSKFWDNYVGVAVMYTHNATVLGVDSRGNRAWAEGYGYLLAEVSGRVANCTAADNVHGFYVLYWGGTRVVVSGCRVEGNYFGVTLRGRNATGVEFVGNVIGDNVVQVSHMGIGEAYANASFRGNLWGGHVSSGPYVYSSAFSDLMTATEGDLAFLAASSARPIIDALAARPIAYDPTPVPDQRLPSLLLAVALLPLVLIWKLR